MSLLLTQVLQMAMDPLGLLLVFPHHGFPALLGQVPLKSWVPDLGGSRMTPIGIFLFFTGETLVNGLSYPADAVTVAGIIRVERVPVSPFALLLYSSETRNHVCPIRDVQGVLGQLWLCTHG